MIEVRHRKGDVVGELNDEYLDSDGSWSFVGFLAGMTALGALIAIEIEAEVESFAAAVLWGAAVSTGLVLTAINVWSAIQRAIWRRTRGYPYMVGDAVEVTRGRYRSIRGRIVSIGQFEASYQIDLQNVGQGVCGWINAAKLRRVA